MSPEKSLTVPHPHPHPHPRSIERRGTKRSLNADVFDAAKEHAAFTAAYNLTIDVEGLPLDEWRSF